MFGKAAATDKDDADYVVDVVVQAAFQLSAGRVGALIVIERGVGLQEYIDTGIELDAVLSVQLLANVFERNSPLHDGAVIIRKNGFRLLLAFCP